MDGEDEILRLVNKEDIRKKSKSKREKYGYLKDKMADLVPWMREQIENSRHKEITVRARDVAKELKLENKSDIALYTGLRFLLFYEGIDIGIKNKDKENFFIMRRYDRGRSGLPLSIIKTLDNIELDGWYIKRDNDSLNCKHSLRKEYNKEFKEDMYILESEGNIYFDRRILTEEQALEFVKYMSSQDMHAPDLVYLTPINIVLTDEFLRQWSWHHDFDVNKIGKEFRIVMSRSGEGNGEGDNDNRNNSMDGNGDGNDTINEIRNMAEFTITSIYGKECIINEFEFDSIVKGCSLRHIIYAFDKAGEIERVPERIDILKKIIPEIKTKNVVMIEGKRLIISNSSGTFYLSLIDGTLHKTYYKDEKDRRRDRDRYICVGPVIGKSRGSIFYNGEKLDIDITTDAIISKMKMLLDEKYPDRSTEVQVKM